MRSRLIFLAIVALVGFGTSPAIALPSFAQQTGQPCSLCHLGGYGPQLKQYGRDFKLYGYVSGDTKNRYPTLSLIFTESFTHTSADRPALPRFSANDNVAFQGATFAYGGALVGGAGTFAETFYNGVTRNFSLATVDIKRAFNPTIYGSDVVLGLDLNNRPTSQDLWNSTPAFEFNAATSPFAALPFASAVIDGALASRVVGAGGYMMWDNWLYAEFTGYLPLDNEVVNSEGIPTPLATSNVYNSFTPYWRIAVQHDFDDHYFEIGGYGLETRRFPGGKRAAGQDQFTDTAADITYQYNGGKEHYVSAHLTWISEDQELNASHVLKKTNASDHLDEVRLDALYSFENTWTPALELFTTYGSRDGNFFKTPGGVPNTSGYVAEVSYTPWGKSDSPVIWANARLTARWVGYTEFNGVKAGADRNDTFYISAKVAIAPFGALVSR